MSLLVLATLERSLMNSSPFSGSGSGANQQLNPGDEAAPGTPDTGEDICPECHGTGKQKNGADCINCGGTGRITEGIGGG
jgi:DnaJ-class molecular chaperone